MRKSSERAKNRKRRRKEEKKARTIRKAQCCLWVRANDVLTKAQQGQPPKGLLHVPSPITAAPAVSSSHRHHYDDDEKQTTTNSAHDYCDFCAKKASNQLNQCRA